MIKAGLSKYSMLLGELVKRDIKIKYKGSALGILWSVINPLLMMLVMNFVFSMVFRFDIEHYIVYLLTGQVFFSFMSESTTASMNAILYNGPSSEKYTFPNIFFRYQKYYPLL
jgi:ABC-type polysaccharide/polyol phosphate export permease